MLNLASLASALIWKPEASDCLRCNVTWWWLDYC